MPMRSVLITIFILFAAPALSESAANEPIAVASPGKPETPLLPVEKKALLSQFKKSLGEEDRAQDRLERASTKEFSNEQSQALKDWRNQEKRTRRTFFDAHLSGPDRRDYVQNYITRKKQFDQKQKDDLAHFKLMMKEKHDHYKADQKNRDQEFKAAIDRNERPNHSLWLGPTR